jgi:hypothetical protein
MKPGDPFDTKDRDERRAEQRLELRLIDDEIIRRATKNMGTAPTLRDADRGLIEEALRDDADAIRAGLFPQTFDGLATLTRNEVIKRFGGTTYNERGGIVEHYGMKFGERAPSISAVADVSDLELGPLCDYVAALILADEAADDEYRDPRLSEAK